MAVVTGTTQGYLPDLLIWDGPVWSGNVAKVKWTVPTTVLTIPCVGSDVCASIGYSVPTLGKLRAICASHKVDLDAHNKVILAGFSAGHGLNEQLLQDPESASRINAFCSFDSYFTGPQPGIKKGYLAYARLAADDQKLMWSSSSGFPGPGYTDCEHAIKPLLDVINPSVSSLPFGLSEFLKPPLYTASAGAFFHASFGTKYAHADHAKIVAPIVLEHFISPALHGGVVRSAVWTAAKFVGAAAVGYGLWKLGQRIVNR